MSIDQNKKTEKINGFFKYFKEKCPKRVLGKHSLDDERICKRCKLVSNSNWKLTRDGIKYYELYVSIYEKNEIKRKIMEVLNKISNKNFNYVSKDLIYILKKEVETSIQINEATKQLFNKIIIEKQFISMYVSLCSELTNIIIKGEPDDRPSKTYRKVEDDEEKLFVVRRAAVSDADFDSKFRAQSSFKNGEPCAGRIPQCARKCRNKYEKITFIKELIKLSQKEYDMIINKILDNKPLFDIEKIRMVNNVEFIGTMYCNNLLHINIIHININKILKILIDNIDSSKPIKTDDLVTLLCKFLTVTGRKMYKEYNKIKIDEYFDKINKIKPYQAKRLQYTILDTIDEYKKWKKKVSIYKIKIKSSNYKYKKKSKKYSSDINLYK